MAVMVSEFYSMIIVAKMIKTRVLIPLLYSPWHSALMSFTTTMRKWKETEMILKGSGSWSITLSHYTPVVNI